MGVQVVALVGVVVGKFEVVRKQADKCVEINGR